MRKAIYLSFIFFIILYSCSKDGTPVSPYLGVYKGVIIDNGFNLAGTFTDTLKDYNIIVTATSYSPRHFFLHHGLINTKEVEITGDDLKIQRKLIAKDDFFEYYEWAEGSFSGVANITLTANFYKETVHKGNVIARIRRNCVLVKQ